MSRMCHWIAITIKAYTRISDKMTHSMKLKRQKQIDDFFLLWFSFMFVTWLVKWNEIKCIQLHQKK